MTIQCLLPLGAAALLLIPGAALAASHAEAPMIAEDPKADNTDTYFFRSPQDPSKVVILANYIPLEEPSGGPTYYYFSDNVLYEVHVDRDNDGEEELTFQFRFRTRVQTPGTFLPHLGPITQLTTNGQTTVSGNNVSPTYNRYQTYTLTLVEHGAGRKGKLDRFTLLARDVIVPPNNAGPSTIPDYSALISQAIHTVPNTGIRTFAGQVDDPFFLDLGAIFDLLRVRPFRSLHALQPLDPRPDRKPAPDSLSGFNCHAIALEVPITFLTGTTAIPGADDPKRLLGVYASASRQKVRVLRADGSEDNDGPWVQVSRLGNPLVNELFLPLADPQGRTRDNWNATEPEDDARFRSFFQFPEPALRLAQLYPALRGIVPNVQVDMNGNPSFTGARNDLLGGVTPLLNFAPDLLRLDVSVPVNPNPSRLGGLGGDAQGYPNGRRLADDVVDIFVRAGAGALVPGMITNPITQQQQTRLEFLNGIDLGDGVDFHENGRFGFRGTFPFVGPAHSGVLPAHIGFDDPEAEPVMP